MKKEIREGEIIPRFYGIAYPLIDRLVIVCYPFPINHLVRVLRNIWIKIRNADFIYEEQRAFEIISKEREWQWQEFSKRIAREREEFEEYKINFFNFLKEKLK